MKERALLFTFLLVALLCTSPAYGFMLSPAKIIVDTQGTHEFTIIFRNTDQEQGVLSVRSEGDLASYVVFDKKEQVLTSSDGDVRIHGTITIPTTITPGDHYQHLIVSLQQPNAGGFSASVELVSLLIVRKRYDGAHLVANIHTTPDHGVPDTTTVFLTLENRGEQSVTPTKIALLGTVQDSQGTFVPIEEYIIPQEIPAGGATSFSRTLHGRGEYEFTLLVDGDVPVDQKFNIVLGYPLISSVEATIIETTIMESRDDRGTVDNKVFDDDALRSFVTVAVDAQLSWNVQISGTVTLGNSSLGDEQKTHTVLLNKSLHETYKLMTNATSIPVTLVVGTQSKIVYAVRPERGVFGVVKAPREAVWWSLLLGLSSLFGYLVWRRFLREQ